MAGDERIMADASLLMIHNPWVMVKGDANALRKEAEDLDTIAQMSIKAYLSKITIEEAELLSLIHIYCDASENIKGESKSSGRVS